MTLEEVIEYLEKMIEIDKIYEVSSGAEEHRQLAEWLRDMVTCFEFMDSMHYNEDIIEWAESELSVDMREVNVDDNIQS